MGVELRASDGIAEIVIDFPPVNALPARGWLDLARALAAAGADPAVRTAAYVSCERIVPTGALLAEGPPQSLLINRAMVHGVAETPGGAHFTSCVPDYGRDEEFQAHYAAAAADPDAWRSFAGEFLAGDEDCYQQSVRQRAAT